MHFIIVFSSYGFDNSSIISSMSHHRLAQLDGIPTGPHPHVGDLPLKLVHLLGPLHQVDGQGGHFLLLLLLVAFGDRRFALAFSI